MNKNCFFIIVLLISIIPGCSEYGRVHLPVLEYTYLTMNVDMTTANIEFGTNEKTTNTLDIAGKSYISTGKDHTFKIEGLQPETEYEVIISTNISEDSPVAAIPISHHASICTQEEDSIPIENLTVTEIFVDSAAFSWNTGVFSNCIVEYGETQDMEIEKETASRDWLSHCALMSNLLPGTTYYYRIKASSLKYGWKDTWSPVQQFTTTSRRNIEFSNIAVSNITVSSAVIKLETNCDADIEVRYTGGSSSGSAKGILINDKEYYVQLNGLEPGITYTYKIIAAPKSHEPSFQRTESEEKEFTTGEYKEIYINIENYSITAISASYNFFTNAPSTCILEYSMNENFTQIEESIESMSPDLYKHTVNIPKTEEGTIKELQENTTYYFRIKATTEIPGYSETISATDNFTTKAKEQVKILTTLHFPSINSATIMWETNLAANSQLHYGTTPGSYPHTVNAVTTNNLRHWVTLDEKAGHVLNPDTSYYYRVTADPIIPGYKEGTGEELQLTTLTPESIVIRANTPESYADKNTNSFAVKISFRTTDAANNTVATLSKVYWTRTPGEYPAENVKACSTTADLENPGTINHEAEITGLSHLSTYYYKIVSGIPENPDFAATTLTDLSATTPDRTPVRITMYRDSIITTSGVEYYVEIDTLSLIRTGIKLFYMIPDHTAEDEPEIIYEDYSGTFQSTESRTRSRLVTGLQYDTKRHVKKYSFAEIDSLAAAAGINPAYSDSILEVIRIHNYLRCIYVFEPENTALYKPTKVTKKFRIYTNIPK
ncbi:MAG: hypothetical protein GY754_25065 [bacterium]|nr:hypothetical protein [bacterium]